MKDNKTLYIIVPCYNESEVLPYSSVVLKDKLIEMIKEDLVSVQSKIVLVNDGSKDTTWEIICNLVEENNIFQGIKLSRNKGHQHALVAGLTYAVDFADIMITIDADLQDDVNAMSEFVKNYHDGCEVVYGVRTSRKKDSFFKRKTATTFYKIMNNMGVETVYNHADYRLLSKRATEALLSFKETNLFLRGLVPLIGFKSTTVGYERSERFAGKSKYPIRKMLSFAADGITSFSTKPLKLLLEFGFLFLIIGTGFNIYFFIDFLIKDFIIYNYHWIVLATIWMAVGIILIALGLIGEYIGKIYFETKERPRFFIDEVKKK